MARFQALTNKVLDDELDMLREHLGLAPSQKADLLREVAALAAWVVRQSEQGRLVEARDDDTVETLAHPAIDRLRAAKTRAPAARIELGVGEVRRLAAILNRGFRPPAGLREALTNLATRRRPPRLRWKKHAA